MSAAKDKGLRPYNLLHPSLYLQLKGEGILTAKKRVLPVSSLVEALGRAQRWNHSRQKG